MLSLTVERGHSSCGKDSCGTSLSFFRQAQYEHVLKRNLASNSILLTRLQLGIITSLDAEAGSVADVALSMLQHLHPLFRATLLSPKVKIDLAPPLLIRRAAVVDVESARGRGSITLAYSMSTSPAPVIYRCQDVRIPVSLTKPNCNYVCAAVTVRDVRTPQYTMVFQVKCQSPLDQQLELHMSKQFIAKTLEQVAAQLDRATDTDITDVDHHVAQWLKHGKPGLSRNTLARWFLARLVVEPSPHTHTLQLAVATDVYDAHHAGITPPVDYSDDEELLPPAYQSDTAITGNSSFDDDADWCIDSGGGDEHVVPASPAAPFPVDTLVSPMQETVPEYESAKDERHTAVLLAGRSKFRFEPRVARLAKQRKASAAGSANEWTEDRRHLQLEVRRSLDDIAQIEQLQMKTEQINMLRRRQVIKQTHRRLSLHDLKREDCWLAKQALADALEYQNVTKQLEVKLENTRIASKRDQERLTQSLRLALGRTEKWKKGPVLGKGPLSQREIDAWANEPRPPTYVYDQHGRRHHVAEAGHVAAESAFESAMKKVGRLLQSKVGSSVELFRKYDLNRSKTLDHDEFMQLLESKGIRFTQEQALAFFSHFDPNKSGEIDYGELLWGFFNRRTFLRRWAQKRSRLSGREIYQLFYKYDRTGRGALSVADFHRAMEDIGFNISDTEAQLLSLRFDADGDGFIDYNEFHSFVNDHNDENGANTPSHQNEATPYMKTEICSDRACILAELDELRLLRLKLDTMMPPSPATAPHTNATLERK